MHLMVKPKQFIFQEKKKSVDSIIGTDYVILFQKALTDITFSASYLFHHPTHFIWMIHCNTTKKEKKKKNQMETKIAKPVSTCHSCRKSDLNHIYNWTNLLKIFLLILDYWVDFHYSLCYGALLLFKCLLEEKLLSQDSSVDTWRSLPLLAILVGLWLERVRDGVYFLQEEMRTSQGKPHIAPRL